MGDRRRAALRQKLYFTGGTGVLDGVIISETTPYTEPGDDGMLWLDTGIVGSRALPLLMFYDEDDNTWAAASRLVHFRDVGSGSRLYLISAGTTTLFGSGGGVTINTILGDLITYAGDAGNEESTLYRNVYLVNTTRANDEVRIVSRNVAANAITTAENKSATWQVGDVITIQQPDVPQATGWLDIDVDQFLEDEFDIAADRVNQIYLMAYAYDSGATPAAIAHPADTAYAAALARAHYTQVAAKGMFAYFPVGVVGGKISLKPTGASGINTCIISLDVVGYQLSA